MRPRRILISAMVATAVVVSSATGVFAASTNLVANPNGAGGTGWPGGSGSPNSTAVVQDGQWWIKYSPTAGTSGGGAPYVWSPLGVQSANTTITCAGMFMGSGTVQMVGYGGANNKGPFVTLSSTPKEVSFSFPITQSGKTAQIQVQGIVGQTMMFDQMECVDGTTTPPAQLAAVAVSGSSSTTSSTASSATSKTTTASSMTASATTTSSNAASSTTASATSKTSTLPKTGESPLPTVAAGFLLLGGIAALVGSRRKARGSGRA